MASMVMMIVTKQILVYKAEPVGHALIMHYNDQIASETSLCLTDVM